MIGDGIDGFGSQGAQQVSTNNEGAAAPNSWPGDRSFAVATYFDGAAELTDQEPATIGARGIVRAVNKFVPVVVRERRVARDRDGTGAEGLEDCRTRFRV